MKYLSMTNQRLMALASVLGVVVLWFVGRLFPETVVGEIFTTGMVARSLRLSVPIALAAVGGLYAEKSGVFNIGLEGLLIFGAFTAAAVSWELGGSQISQLDLWIAVLVAMAVSAAIAAIFAVFTIRYKANQIVAGLAIWFLGLGFAPFAAIVLWDRVNSPSLNGIDTIVVPGLSEIPLLGPVLFEASPFVPITVGIVILAYLVLYYTRWGYWVQAAGENPEALDTAGVSVNRVRYASVIFSGVLCGLGGAALSIGFSEGFVGRGVTMVDGRGWIAIVAYLFGNYNPLGAFGASLLFGGVNALQIQLQTIGVSIPNRLSGLFPYIAVLIVLAFVGGTRIPSAAGEPYETESE
ncbi:inner-membrane translocator [Salinarchaeum sp. Harcht-Bsk1]|uniref:ABC transporter permease n=1 Tax=Salinarchaeum sp. Harcht-Bsk1 TaxID=1333523 RepID=UPI000342447B|nr:ABC transporter permease [Salinarchaeum sp. Harcht-Bsk1]AGN01247.1 inner-membrane translocator [Salinarchaeum sp. Harcht-Bsk1]